MVLKRIFKSKEQRKKDKLKTDLKKQISSTGTNRNQAGKKKRLQRELKAVDAPKKEVNKTGGGGRISRSSQNMSGKNADGTRKGSITNKKDDKKKVVNKSTTGKTKAQRLALANIKKYGGTASAAKANKEAMKKKIRERYLKNKKK